MGDRRPAGQGGGDGVAQAAAGVLAGSSIGSTLLGRINTRLLRWVFVLVLCWIGVEMLRKGLR